MRKIEEGDGKGDKTNWHEEGRTNHFDREVETENHTRKEHFIGEREQFLFTEAQLTATTIHVRAFPNKQSQVRYEHASLFDFKSSSGADIIRQLF